MDSVPPIPFLPSVDLTNLPTESDENFNLRQLFTLGCAHFTLSSANIHNFFQFLEENVGLRTYADVRAVEKTEDIINLINAGVFKVFVTSTQREALTAYSSRLILVQTTEESLPLKSDVNGLLLDMPDDATVAESHLDTLSTVNFSPVYLMSSKSNLDSYIAVAKKFSAIPIIPTSCLTTGSKIQGKVSIPNYIAAVWKSDREDKLVTTVVTDIRGQALGLVYSNEKSLAESLRTGTGVYQSRNRGLWYKGATSGDTQKLLQISLDCDLDCLKFVVQQQGKGMYPVSQNMSILIV
ncbi:hypothetical protein K3495_g6871 [Podosphaera aphanis]|nr:hypothetical protein K3495_g6871 [Podosphaera aphanis]